MATEIKKIVLDLSGKEVELTPKQAKKLHELLDAMYGEKKVNFTYPVYVERYRPYWEWHTPCWSTSSGSTAKFSNDSSTMTLSV